MPPRVRKVELLRRPGNKSPFWYLRWWELRADQSTWKECWRSTKTTIKKDAEKKRRELERKLDAGEHLQTGWLWEDFVTEFMEKHVYRKAHATKAAYHFCLKAFGKTAKPKMLADINLAMLEDFANARLEEQIKPATVNKELRHLRAAMRWAYRREYISRVPDFGAAFIRVSEHQPITIPEEDFMSMVKALDTPELQLQHRSARWWRVFLYLAYYLGLRRGEIIGLTWQRVNLDAHEVTVSANTSKGRKDRVLPFAAELSQLLLDWKRNQLGDSVQAPPAEVLPWPFDNYRQLYEDWHAVQAAAGIPEGKHYVPKNCRSSCASELIAAGVPTAVVKDFLGHSTVTTTEKYYINTKPALRSVVKARRVRLA